LTWGDAASIRIKVKVPATQRHHHECAARARWLAISQVRLLYGLPTYIAGLVNSRSHFGNTSFFSPGTVM